MRVALALTALGLAGCARRELSDHAAAAVAGAGMGTIVGASQTHQCEAASCDAALVASLALTGTALGWLLYGSGPPPAANAPPLPSVDLDVGPPATVRPLEEEPPAASVLGAAAAVACEEAEPRAYQAARARCAERGLEPVDDQRWCARDDDAGLCRCVARARCYGA